MAEKPKQVGLSFCLYIFFCFVLVIFHAGFISALFFAAFGFAVSPIHDHFSCFFFSRGLFLYGSPQCTAIDSFRLHSHCTLKFHFSAVRLKNCVAMLTRLFCMESDRSFVHFTAFLVEPSKGSFLELVCPHSLLATPMISSWPSGVNCQGERSEAFLVSAKSQLQPFLFFFVVFLIEIFTHFDPSSDRWLLVHQERVPIQEKEEVRGDRCVLWGGGGGL